ncbi:hypothetical protein Asd1617_03262 [Shigella dysenteriae 1617]|uniref:Uncharacterized protein n=1 Tax=Shigella dysenteriae 1617 TaxID=754093 RepID=A0A0A6ZW58_SHIDY|nr:hypothetical protein Asd1617_03262 [Shigella dysenteriae 1617]
MGSVRYCQYTSVMRMGETNGNCSNESYQSRWN